MSTGTQRERGGQRRAGTPAEWLAELSGALRMPFERAEAIREELAEHLRERVRDLELEGLDESAAARAAVQELGDAAAMARRYRHVERTTIRRRIMNIAVIGLAGAALVTSIVAVTGGSNPGSVAGQRAAAFVAGPGQAAPPTPALEAKDKRLAEVLGWLAEQSKRKALVRWNVLEELGVSPDETVSLTLPEGDLASALTAINESRGAYSLAHEAAIDYRLRDGVVEFAPRVLFDRRETQTVRYDVGDILEEVEVDELVELITAFVEPDNWENNGGDMAFLKIVGGRMFVQAPPRMHERVRWFIEQLGDRREARGREAAEAHVARVYQLAHAEAGEVLKLLSTNTVIRAIDFTAFGVDPRTNSIIGRATPAEHRIVGDAIEALDRPARGAREAAEAVGKSLGG